MRDTEKKPHAVNAQLVDASLMQEPGANVLTRHADYFCSGWHVTFSGAHLSVRTTRPSRYVVYDMAGCSLQPLFSLSCLNSRQLSGSVLGTSTQSCVLCVRKFSHP